MMGGARGTVLVTGANGFVGRSLVPALSEAGWTVVPTSRHGGNGSSALDVTDVPATRRFLQEQRPDALIHLAGVTYLPEVMDSPARAFDVNVLGTLNVLESILGSGRLARVLLISSCTVYGAPDRLPVDESAPLKAVHPYGLQKVGGELLARRFQREGLDCVVLRPFNHLGPGQDPRISANHFASEIVQAERGEKDRVIRVGNLAARRDFLDVRDVVRAYLMVLEHPNPPKELNVARGESTAMGDVLELLLQRARVPCTQETEPSRLRPLDVPDLVGDASLLKRVTGWTPSIPLTETLDRIMAAARGEVLSPW